MVRNYYEENLPVIREKQARYNREKSFVVNEARRKNYKKRKLENQNPEDRTNCRIKKFPKLYWEGPTFVCVVCNNCLYRNGRSSHQRCSVKKDVLRNLTKFTGKQSARVSFLIKLSQTLAQVFSCEFCEISKNTFFTEHLWTTASEMVLKHTHDFDTDSIIHKFDTEESWVCYTCDKYLKK